MIGHRHRFDQRTQLQRHVVRQLVQHVGGHHGVLGHAAVGHQAVEGDLLADVVVAGAARRAVPALVDRLDGHPVALGETRDTVADGGDGAGEFVADGQRHLLAGQRMRFGRHEDRPRVVLVQIGAANPVEPHLYLHRARARLRLGYISHLDLVRSVINSCFHASVLCDLRHSAQELQWVATPGGRAGLGRAQSGETPPVGS